MKRLRSGYTTGACAAAAAKAAACLLVTGEAPQWVSIPMPDGTRVDFPLCACQWADDSRLSARAAVIKDAGDDPDVTNGARIETEVSWIPHQNIAGRDRISLVNGPGVGMVSRPGLALGVGEPAINPVPRQMIRAAVSEALAEKGCLSGAPVRVTISIADGEVLAAKTLNSRLGIVGGLSILGTTGIVRPVSAEAWTATISLSMSVAREAGRDEIVLSTGRTSEAAAQKRLGLPDEALVMMGDYLHFSLLEARKQGFAAIHLAVMWAKAVKAAMRIPQTHVRHGALEVEGALAFLASLGTDAAVLRELTGANTVREIYERLLVMPNQQARSVIPAVCCAARAYAQEVSGLPVTVHLVNSSRQIVASIAGTDCS